MAHYAAGMTHADPLHPSSDGIGNGALAGASSSAHDASDVLSDAALRRLAHLARLRVEDEDLPALRERLGAILAHAGALASLDLERVLPMHHPVELVAPLGEDEPRAGLDRAAFASMAPAWDEPFLPVPKVIQP
jgi:aspartyl-tRNA(Asn)/glutamyl-tRNA(Gln) amidotransferase subunit C